MNGRPLVYLSGPMTPWLDVTAEEHVARALRVYLKYVKAGVPTICPQLSGAFPSAWTVVPYDAWIAHDFGLIDRCTHVVLLPGWEQSRGARAERAYAEEHGVRVLEDWQQALEVLGRYE